MKTEEMMRRFLGAVDLALDRIQGFNYDGLLVIRDVSKPHGEQVLWRGSSARREEYEARLDMEQLRKTLEIAGLGLEMRDDR